MSHSYFFGSRATHVGGLVQVDDTAGDVRLDIALQGAAASGDRGEVAGADEDCLKKLELTKLPPNTPSTN